MCGTMEEKEKVEEFKSFKEASRSFFFLLQVATKRDAIPLVEVSRRKSEQEKLKLSWVQYHWLSFQREREKEWKREGEVGPAASDPFSLNFLREENNPSPNPIIFPWSWQEMSNFAHFPSKYFCPFIISSSLKKNLKQNVRVIESEHPTRAFLRRLPTTRLVISPHKLLIPEFLWDLLKL